VQDFKILKFFTPLPIHFQLNLNTNTERVNSLIVHSCTHGTLIISYNTSYIHSIKHVHISFHTGLSFNFYFRQNGFHFVRLDGTMSNKQRSASIEAFSDLDPASPVIILLSLKAGGVGLNLTAGSRVFLMEPVSNDLLFKLLHDYFHFVYYYCVENLLLYIYPLFSCLFIYFFVHLYHSFISGYRVYKRIKKYRIIRKRLPKAQQFRRLMWCHYT